MKKKILIKSLTPTVREGDSRIRDCTSSIYVPLENIYTYFDKIFLFIFEALKYMHTSALKIKRNTVSATWKKSQLNDQQRLAFLL